MSNNKILIWLPSPLGDAILCTPALRAIRKQFPAVEISFYANNVVRDVLSPSSFNNRWLEQESQNPLTAAMSLRKYKFDRAILFKNSFASALTFFLAGIPNRLGYGREARSVFLTEKLYPPKTASGDFLPHSMVDYYLALAEYSGADIGDKSTELVTNPQDDEKIIQKFPFLANRTGPVVIFVPGGAFGPSKCWPAERFARVADFLVEKYNAIVVLSVAPDRRETAIAEKICASAKSKLINLADTPLSLGRLKSLFSRADLVISNDTGPRHIAIALKRNVITLFGPNDPKWTDTGYKNEIQLKADVFCAPCRKPKCGQPQHLCMEAISVEMVQKAAEKILSAGRG